MNEEQKDAMLVTAAWIAGIVAGCMVVINFILDVGGWWIL